MRAPQFPPVTSTEIDGLTVLQAALPGPAHATLTFGVGLRDEPAHLVGISHLLEHVLFRQLEPLTVLHNGSTEHDETRFWADGSEAEVARFLADVGRAATRIAAGDVDQADLEREKRIIREEIGETQYFAVMPGIGTLRHGAGGLGNYGATCSALDAISAAELADWCRTWFVRENAVLGTTVADASALPVDLPRGPRPARHLHPGAPAVTPATFDSPKSGMAVSFIVRTDVIEVVAAAVEFEVMATLRHEEALVYSISMLTAPLPGGRHEVTMIVDPESEELATIIDRVRSVLAKIFAVGLGEHALTHGFSAERTQLQWHLGAVAAYLDAEASAILRGEHARTPDERWELLETTRPADIARSLAEAEETILWVVDEDIDLGPVAKRLPGPIQSSYALTTVERKDLHVSRSAVTWRGRWRAGRRGARVTVDGTRVILRDDETSVFSLEDVIHVVLHGEEIGFVDRSGRGAWVDPSDFRRSSSLSDALLSAVPEPLRRPVRVPGRG